MRSPAAEVCELVVPRLQAGTRELARLGRQPALDARTWHINCTPYPPKKVARDRSPLFETILLSKLAPTRVCGESKACVQRSVHIDGFQCVRQSTTQLGPLRLRGTDSDAGIEKGIRDPAPRALVEEQPSTTRLIVPRCWRRVKSAIKRGFGSLRLKSWKSAAPSPIGHLRFTVRTQLCASNAAKSSPACSTMSTFLSTALLVRSTRQSGNTPMKGDLCRSRWRRSSGIEEGGAASCRHQWSRGLSGATSWQLAVGIHAKRYGIWSLHTVGSSLSVWNAEHCFVLSACTCAPMASHMTSTGRDGVTRAAPVYAHKGSATAILSAPRAGAGYGV
jgi:hypothetical protein